MSPQSVLLVGIAAVMTVAGNLMMREGVVRAGGFALAFSTLVHDLTHLARQPLFDIGVLIYGLASLVWFRIISTENLNSSYPLLVGLTFLFVTIGATLIFKEPLSLQKIAGIGVILLGIIMVATSRQTL
jgi:multidrug transporter EmrE-like cation transporter